MPSQDSYFPLFISFKNRNILLIGGGKIAFEKLKKLLEFTTNIKLISLEFSLEMLELVDKYSLVCERREYKSDDLKAIDFVVVAVNDESVHKKVYEDSRELKVFVNSVDNQEFCDFIFPSIIKDENLTLAISTNGASPAVSKYLKRFLQKKLPKNINNFIKEMKNLRKSLPKGQERMKLLEQKAKEFFRV